MTGEGKDVLTKQIGQIGQLQTIGYNSCPFLLFGTEKNRGV